MCARADLASAQAAEDADDASGVRGGLIAESPAAAVLVARRTPATICPLRRRASVSFAETARDRPRDIIFFGISGFAASSLEVEGRVEEIYQVCARADWALAQAAEDADDASGVRGDSSCRALQGSLHEYSQFV